MVYPVQIKLPFFQQDVLNRTKAAYPQDNKNNISDDEFEESISAEIQRTAKRKRAHEPDVAQTPQTNGSRMNCHPQYYLQDGNITFHVEGTLFRVHRHFFERESQFFIQEFAKTPQGGTSDTSAFRLDEVTAANFTKFLWVWYSPLYRRGSLSEPKEHWLTILELSTKWQFPDMQKLAVDELEKLDIEHKTPQTNGIDRVDLFKCPRDGCLESLPTNISPQLKELLDARQVHLTVDGQFSVPFARNELEICVEITKCRRSEVLLQRALTFGWPTAIDFKSIPPRVKVLEGEVQRLLTSHAAKESCYVFNIFVTTLITEFGMNRKQVFDSFSKHKKFKMSAPQRLLDVARPGYYGPKGYAVIQACIQHLVDPTTTFTTAFEPLTLQQYTHFVLIPFIALRLIMEDLKSEDEMDAHEYMIGSGDVGDMLQSLDRGCDDDIDNIIMTVVRVPTGSSNHPPAKKKPRTA